MRIHHKSKRALDAAEYMTANPDSSQKIHDYAEALAPVHEVSSKFIRTVRTMLEEGCPEELKLELRHKAITVPDAKRDFEAFKSGVPTDIPGSYFLYLLSLDGDNTVEKIGTTNDLPRRVADLELASGTLILRAAWKFENRAAARAVEREVLRTFAADRERITSEGYMQKHEMAVGGGGRWVPVAAGFDQSGRLL